MRHLLTLLMLLPLTAMAQLSDGYYHLMVVRQGRMMYGSNSLLQQSESYAIPATYTTADLAYIWHLQTTSNGSCTLQNCKSLEYVAMPTVSTNQISELVPTGNQAATFTIETTSDGKCYGFATTATKEETSWGWGGNTSTTTQVTAYLNDYSGEGQYICLWTDGPDKDDGSQFSVVKIDEDIVEPLMANTTPEKIDLVSFQPTTGTTYTIYSGYVNGYMAGNGNVSAAVNGDCEYDFEIAGQTTDNLPTYYIKHVSTGLYLQHVTLSGYEDSSDTGQWTPYGDKSTAAKWTILKAIKACTDQRANSENCIEGQYVACDVQTYTQDGQTVYTYLGAYSGRPFLSPWTDSNHLTISKYVAHDTDAGTTTQEEVEDQSAILWGEPTDTLSIHFTNGRMLLIPDNMIADRDANGKAAYTYAEGQLKINLQGGKQMTWAQNEISEVGFNHSIAADHPTLRTFKFNNKYNSALITDALGEIITPDSIYVAVASCIGKTLCPSFSVTDPEAIVYYKGQRQISHQNKNRFDKILTYTVALPGQTILQVTKTKDEIWSTPSNDGNEISVALTESMLSTNAPSNYGQDLSLLLDGSLSTYFHSTWGSGAYEKLNYDANNPNNTEWPYIDIALSTSLQNFKLTYTTQGDGSGSSRIPTSFDIYGSTDGANWTLLTALDEGLPTGFSEQYTSPTITASTPVTYLRLQLTSCVYKNYLCLSELGLIRVETTSTSTDEPTLVQEAEYDYTERPWGRDVKIRTDFLTDQATTVPRIDINLDGGYYYSMISKTEYLPATITIQGYGAFPDMEETAVNIRGRGNSSWSFSKKPYRLKFDTKQKPFGLTKGKSWCLIAQAQAGSMLTNPIALRLANMIGTVAANHVIPVDLYISGVYRGSYFFTENPGFANNSIDIDETNAYLIELDTYCSESYTVYGHFYQSTSNQGLPFGIKDPDYSELADGEEKTQLFNTIEDQIHALEEAIYYGNTETYENMTDIDSFERFMLVNDVVRNCELKHPKSIKFYRENAYNEDNKFVWGPVWDFDWAFGYDGTSTYYVYSAETDMFEYDNKSLSSRCVNSFFADMQTKSETLQAYRYMVWTEFMEKYRDELLDYIDDYFAYAEPSFISNATRWADGNSYASNAESAKNWLKTRTNWVYSNMTPYDIPAITYGTGDCNEDGQVSAADLVCVINTILGKPVDVFNQELADCNGDGKITLADAVLIIKMAMGEIETTGSARQQIPMAHAEWQITPFQTSANTEAEVQVDLETEEDAAAAQFDLLIPTDATLTNVRTRGALSRFKTRIRELCDGRYRVLIYSEDGTELTAGAQGGLTLDITMGDMPAAKADRRIRIASALLSSAEGTESRMPTASALFAQATPVEAISADEITLRGGEDLTIESVKGGNIQIYNTAGTMVANVALKQGRNSINLPMGIYIVAGHKITID